MADVCLACRDKCQCPSRARDCGHGCPRTRGALEPRSASVKVKQRLGRGRGGKNAARTYQGQGRASERKWRALVGRSEKRRRTAVMVQRATRVFGESSPRTDQGAAHKDGAKVVLRRPSNAPESHFRLRRRSWERLSPLPVECWPARPPLAVPRREFGGASAEACWYVVCFQRRPCR